MAADFEKYAYDLAAAAATGAREPLVRVIQPFTKSADLSALLKDPAVQRYLLGGLGGAGIGALIGGLQPQKKKRNALMYGLMGGMGGLGLAHLMGSNIPGAAAAGEPNKPFGDMSAADIAAAAAAAGISPQEYIRQQGQQETSKAWRQALLADGGVADRAGGSVAGLASYGGVRSVAEGIRNRIFGTRGPDGKLVPPPPRPAPLQQAQKALAELRYRREVSDGARDTQLHRAQRAHDQGVAAARAQISPTPAEHQMRRNLRGALDAETARLRQETAELVRQHRAGTDFDIVRDTNDPGYRQRQLQEQIAAAEDAARRRKKTIAGGYRAEGQNYAASRRAASAAEAAAAADFAAAQSEIAATHAARRAANRNFAHGQVAAVRPGTMLPRTINVPIWRGQPSSVNVRNPLGRAITTVAPFVPAAAATLFGGSEGLSGIGKGLSGIGNWLGLSGGSK